MGSPKTKKVKQYFLLYFSFKHLCCVRWKQIGMRGQIDLQTVCWEHKLLWLISTLMCALAALEILRDTTYKIQNIIHWETGSSGLKSVSPLFLEFMFRITAYICYRAECECICWLTQTERNVQAGVFSGGKNSVIRTGASVENGWAPLPKYLTPRWFTDRRLYRAKIMPSWVRGLRLWVKLIGEE